MQTSNVSLGINPIWGILILTDGSTTSNAQSRLLKLPQEIKDQIYVLVCGGNLLHFEWAWEIPRSDLSESNLRHVKCLSRTTEEEAQASFEASKSPWFDEVNVSRHKDCCSFVNALGLCELDLRFLRACHQIYDEAWSFCYTDNIFSFDDWQVFAEFGRTVTRVSYVRSIRISTFDLLYSDTPLTREWLQNIFDKLTGLQRIDIDWEQLPGYLWKYDQGAGEAIHLTQQLLCFSGKGLKTTGVIISDADFCNYIRPEIPQPAWDDDESQRLNRWTMTQKQEYSRFLRNALLQHRGK